MGFFDWLTGAHDQNEDREKTGKMGDLKKRLKMAEPRQSGNVEQNDEEMLKQMGAGRR